MYSGNNTSEKITKKSKHGRISKEWIKIKKNFKKINKI